MAGKRILLLSSAIAPLQSGKMGGVKSSLLAFANAMHNLGHSPVILVPLGSHLAADFPLLLVPGELQETLQYVKNKNEYTVYVNSFLANAFDVIRKEKQNFDFVVNFSNDWLPYYMTHHLDLPILHFSSLGDVHHVVTDVVQKTAKAFPKRVACLSKSHAKSLNLAEKYFLLGQGIDCAKIPFYAKSEKPELCYFGRISPEKGLEKMLAVAKYLQRPLKVIGYVEDEAYFKFLLGQYPETLYYRGFLQFDDLVKELKYCSCVLHLHKSEETFGLVLLEAMAMGLPVVVSDFGAPQEFVLEDMTGFLIPLNASIEWIATKVNDCDKLDRLTIRNYVEKNFSMPAFTEKCKSWLIQNQLS